MTVDRLAWERDGYAVVDLGLSWHEMAAVMSDISCAPREYRTQAQHEKGGNARIFQAHRFSGAVRALALHPDVLAAVALLTGRAPTPFQTLNFSRGTQQPLHQDAIHFDSDPPGGVVGVWVALEDVRPGSGELLVCPGSHVELRWDYEALGIPRAERGTPEDAAAYRQYEARMAEIAEEYEQVPLRVRAGQAVVWHGNLIHGGAPITDPTLTRWSQATHYFLAGAKRYVCPMFGTEKDPAALAIR